MVSSFLIVCRFPTLFFVPHSTRGKKSCNSQKRSRVSKSCNYARMSELFPRYNQKLRLRRSFVKTRRRGAVLLPQSYHISRNLQVFSQKTLDIRPAGCYNTQAKGRRSAAPSSPHASAKRSDIEASALWARFVRCGCCAASAFSVSVMEVLYHRQIRSSAQRRNPRQGSPPDRFRRNHARYRLLRSCAGNG